MAYERITVQLTTEERGALLQIAELECRDPREQMRFLLRKEAQQRGLIAHVEPVSDEAPAHSVRCDQGNAEIKRF